MLGNLIPSISKEILAGSTQTEWCARICRRVTSGVNYTRGDVYGQKCVMSTWVTGVRQFGASDARDSEAYLRHKEYIYLCTAAQYTGYTGRFVASIFARTRWPQWRRGLEQLKYIGALCLYCALPVGQRKNIEIRTLRPVLAEADAGCRM